jgi:hypothetical protein
MYVPSNGELIDELDLRIPARIQECYSTKSEPSQLRQIRANEEERGEEGKRVRLSRTERREEGRERSCKFEKIKSQYIFSTVFELKQLP